MLSSRCYLRKHIQNCMCLWKIVSRMLKEKYKWNIPISKVFMRERKKNLRTISHCLIFQPFFIGSLNQNLLCQKKKQISLWSFFSQIWRLLLDNNYLLTLYNNSTTWYHNRFSFIHYCWMTANIKKNQDQKNLITNFIEHFIKNVPCFLG